MKIKVINQQQTILLQRSTSGWKFSEQAKH